MRYIINDDDFEDWIDRLKEVNSNYSNLNLEYVISEMEDELKQHVKKKTCGFCKEPCGNKHCPMEDK